MYFNSDRAIRLSVIKSDVPSLSRYLGRKIGKKVNNKIGRSVGVPGAHTRSVLPFVPTYHGYVQSFDCLCVCLFVHMFGFFVCLFVYIYITNACVRFHHFLCSLTLSASERHNYQTLPRRLHLIRLDEVLS